MPAMTLLKMSPNEKLEFNKNSQSPCKVLTLTNQSNGMVAFKVKTTAPKSYLVRPSAGTLSPGLSQEVQIILQPQAALAEEANPPDRFLVQAVEFKGDQGMSRDDWAKVSKDKVQEHKLNVEVKDGDADDAAKPNQVPTRGDVARGAKAPASDAELKVQYDELVTYAISLEKEKKKLEADLAEAQSSRGGGGQEGFSKATLFLAVLVAFIVPYAAKFLG